MANSRSHGRRKFNGIAPAPRMLPGTRPSTYGIGARTAERYCTCGGMKDKQGLCKRGCSK